jgi:F-box and WD-40 domain protein CDC4
MDDTDDSNSPLVPLSLHSTEERVFKTRRSGGKARASTSSSAMDLDESSAATLGQFSFAPATQTTVVTTTTTTTTRFPPMLMRAPQHGHQLDTKLFPLATTPTPDRLKNISFQIGGQSAIFREAADSSIALEQLQEEQKILSNANGTVQTIQKYEPWVETDPDQASHPLALPRMSRPGRPASPESFTEAELSLSAVGTSSSHHAKRRRLSNLTSTHRPRPSLQTHLRVRGMRSTNPITPESQPRLQGDLRRSGRHATRPSRATETLLPSPTLEQRAGFDEGNNHSDNEMGEQGQDLGFVRGGSNQRDASHDTAVPTPPIEADTRSSSGTMSGRALSSIPARLHVAESPSGQDGSLPSPSLSPVTAAANLHNGGYFADADIDSASELASQYDQPLEEIDPTPSKPGSRPLTAAGQTGSRFASFSITEIPAMLDFFEAMPDELKGYVMHQLLRRCPKDTLHVVADVVNPALKCDFLALLPAELSLTIVRYLDLTSLCRAAQVSKKWRRLINSDEKVWKELFDADGFSLAENEMQTAIAEGWGWQDPSGPDGFEQDISMPILSKSDTEGQASSPSNSQGGLTGLLRRSKRKAATMLSSRNKATKKRRTTSRESSVDINSINWMDLMTTAEGPYNAANAALVAVPQPKCGISSLRGLHLYKSLYRRHHLIRRNWMYEDTKPRHIAFRAHETHVVTCLQFDTDKILTGSDDNNINVYDTKTGALRAKLAGHEGGVWALQYEGNILVSGSTDRSVRVWDIEKGEQRQVFRGHTSTVRCLQVVMPVETGRNADGKSIMTPRQPLIITGSRDSTLRVWRLPRSEDAPFIQDENDNDADDCPYFVRTLTGHQHSVRAIAAHADTLVSGSYDCTVRVWKISTGDTVRRLQGHTQKVYSVVLDHERNRCISGSMDNMVRIWSLETGAPLYVLEGHTSLVGLLDLNCDRLVSAAADSTLRIWDPDNGQCKATLSAHTGAITCFQHDGQKVISGSDRTLKLWNIKTGECVKDLLSDLSGVWQVKFNERRCVAAVQREGVTFIEVSRTSHAM